MREIDEIAVEMLNAIKESEENYKREQEQARIRDEQLRSARQTSRSDINLYPTLANSTPIRNSNTRSDQPGVHFNTNPVHHIYATTSDGGDQYEPPENDSILQGATSSPVDQFATNATNVVGHNKPWRRNNATNTSSNTINHRQQPDQPVAMDCKMTIHQTPQTPEMDRHASDAENKTT